jgi:hypothetical protein
MLLKQRRSGHLAESAAYWEMAKLQGRISPP